MGLRSQNNPIASFRDVFSRTGKDAMKAASVPVRGHTATGGVISDWTEPGPGNVYRSHIFTSSGTFEITQLSSTYPAHVDYMVIAGGGGAGVDAFGPSPRGSGGGGAGGIHSNHPDLPEPRRGSSVSVAVAPYVVTVGGGGGSGPSAGGRGNNGGDSSLAYDGGTITSSGGGGGGGHTSGLSNGNPGGCGGGATNDRPGLGVVSPSNQGFPGGNGATTDPYAGGGGGGIGGPGGGAPNSQGGNGGVGLQIRIAGAPTINGIGAENPGPGEYQWFGGGGAGYGPAGTAGVGGGGIAGPSPPNTTTTLSGKFGTGGGGGGTRNQPAGNGGSGIVVVRYQIGQLTATAKATGGAISFYNGKTIHTFVTSGTFATSSNWSAATVDYLVVGGGGAGGSGGPGQYGGAGGGAGAVRIGTTPIGAHPVSTTIQVGAGGAGVKSNRGIAGNPSYFGTPITAPGGGGGGGADPAHPGGPGGSGGGSKYNGSPITGGPGTGTDYPGSPPDASPTAGWGNPGGNGSNEGAGGGGGAGSAGSSSPGSPGKTGGPGGTGIQIPSTFYNPSNSVVGYPGSSGTGWIAGGGGGSTYGNPNAGGGGGGGRPAGNPDTGYAGAGHGQKNYSTSDPVQPQEHGNAGANSGSGGGGNNNGRMSFDGGSGIVIIAYPS